MGTGGGQGGAIPTNQYTTYDPNLQTLRFENGAWRVFNSKGEYLKDSKGNVRTFNDFDTAVRYFQDPQGNQQAFNLGGFFVKDTRRSGAPMVFIPDTVQFHETSSGDVVLRDPGGNNIVDVNGRGLIQFSSRQDAEKWLSSGWSNFQTETDKTGSIYGTSLSNTYYANAPKTVKKATVPTTPTPAPTPPAPTPPAPTPPAPTPPAPTPPAPTTPLRTEPTRMTDPLSVFKPGTTTTTPITTTPVTPTTPSTTTPVTTPSGPTATEIAAAAERERLARIKELEDKLASAQSQYDALFKTYGETQGSYQDLTKRFEDLYGQFDTLSGTYADQSAAYNELFGGYKTLEQQLADQRAALGTQETAYKSLLDEYAGLQGNLGGLQTQYTGLEEQFGGLRNQYDELMQRLAEEQLAYQASLEEAARRRRRDLASLPIPTGSGYSSPAVGGLGSAGYSGLGGQQQPTLSPGAYQAPTIDFLADIPSFLQMSPDLRMPDFIGQYAIQPLPGTSPVQAGPTTDVAAPFQPYLEAIYKQYGVNIPSGMSGIMGGRR